MDVAILGPLLVRDDTGHAVEIAGARLRALLSRLALDAGRSVSAAALTDAVWGDQVPGDAVNALQTLVSRLRRQLGPDSIVQSGAGYCLPIEPDQVDAHRFRRLAAQGAAELASGDSGAAAATLRVALALWRGPALVDAGESSAADAVLLADLRHVAVLDRCAADIVQGQTSGLVAELEALAVEHPLDERLAGLLMTALTRAGRQADALATYARTRAKLADDLGVDPSAALQSVHVEVLRGEIGADAPPVERIRRTNLKSQLTSFVGRDEEVARIAKLLEQNRLVTLVGPGGAGKTRLATEAVADVDALDGVWFVELASVTDQSGIAQTVLGSLGLRESHLLDTRAQLSTRDATTRLLDALVDKDAVLVLDNCEHLIDGCAHLADTLLAQCPSLRVLTTSREPLGIFGESLLVVPPLDQPREDESAAAALAYPAVRLFADRAASVRPDFEIDDGTVRTVIEIVRRLDGLPLAIELAAARLRTLPLGEIASRLTDRFRLLTGGSRTALPRHRTLRAVVEWSWELLSPAERLLAERLAVFPAGATAASAAAICGDSQVPDVDASLASLLDKSLLTPVADGSRLRMLETIREYGIERLAERGELADARQRHAAYFADVIREADEYLRTAEQLPWMRLIDAERDNIVAALRYLVDVGDAQQALEVAAGIGGYWMFTGAHTEATAWMTLALEAQGTADEELRLLVEAMVVLTTSTAVVNVDAEAVAAGMARLRDLNDAFEGADMDVHPMLALMRPVIAMFSDDENAVERAIQSALMSSDPWVRAASRMFRANVAENVGDLDQMRVDIADAYGQFLELGERWGLASCLQMYGLLATVAGDLDLALQHYRRALDYVSELGAHDDAAWLHLRLADIHMRQGEFAAAAEFARQARDLGEATGSPREAIFGRLMLADVVRRAGDVDEAARLRADVLARLERMPIVHPLQGHGVAMALAIAAHHELLDGDPDLARRHLYAAATAAIGTKDQPIMANVAVVAAMFAINDGDASRAARVLGAAHRLRGAADSTHPDILALTTRLRAELGDTGFEKEYAAGQQLDRDEAIELLPTT